MNIADFAGAPIQDPPDESVLASPTCPHPPPDAAGPEPEPSRRTRPWIVATVVGAVGLGMLAGWVAAQASRGDQPATPHGGAVPMPSEVAGTAELFTTRYLSGQVTSAGSLYAGDLPEPTGAWVNHTAAVAGTTRGDGVWDITVAVDSLEPVDGTYKPVALTYFVVPISTQHGRPYALAAPSRIADPGRPIPESEFHLQVPPDQAATATAFLATYLTAGAEIGRYVSTPSSIEVFAVAPYVEVKSTNLAADSLGRVKATVAATTESNVTHSLEYILTLQLQSGVWVVSGIGASSG